MKGSRNPKKKPKAATQSIKISGTVLMLGVSCVVFAVAVWPWLRRKAAPPSTTEGHAYNTGNTDSTYSVVITHHP